MHPTIKWVYLELIKGLLNKISRPYQISEYNITYRFINKYKTRKNNDC